MRELRKRIDGRKVSVHPHGAEAVQAIEDRWGPIAVEIDQLVAKRGRIRGNVELTPAGQERALASLDQEEAGALARKLAAIEDRLLKEYDDLKAAENAAVAGLRKEGGGYFKDASVGRLERTPEVREQEREVRDLLRGQGTTPGERLELSNKYLVAVAENSDLVFVSAIENSPRAFPIVTDETLAQAREIRISRSPWAEGIHAMRALYDAHCFLLEMARSELYAAFLGLQQAARQNRPALPKLTAPPRLPFGVERLLKAKAS